MATSHATLATLVKLRQRELDDAREQLAACIAKERDAMARVQDAEATIRHEQTCAASLDASDAAVEAFAAWLPTGRALLAAAERGRGETASATIQARARLTAARAAAEAAAEIRDAAMVVVRAERDRRLQSDLDEAGRRHTDG